MRSLVILVIIISVSGCRSAENTLVIQKDLDSISAKWVPDEREGISRIILEKNDKDIFVLSGETDNPALKKEITEYMAGLEEKYTDNFTLLPGSDVNEKHWGLVTVSVCNIKADPSYSSELVSQTIMGTPVKILKRKGSWLLVQTPDFYQGWANDSSIREMSTGEIESWKKSKRIIYINNSGDILSDDNNGTTVSDLVAGAILVNSGERTGIIKVTLPDGRTGRIDREQTVDFNTWCSVVKPEPDKLIKFAKKFVGYPYMWGGTSTKAMDCSGFVKTVYFAGGIILARDASQQFLHGIRVDISSSLDDLQPADLVFFGYTNKEGVERIIHVGMYLGDTEVIHSSGMVRINSLDSTRSNYSAYLGKGLRGARRIIGAASGKGTQPVAVNSWYITQK